MVSSSSDATGIAAIACARHGCFAPGAVVDLQKGERQMNIDWALCEALKTTHVAGIPKVGLDSESCYWSFNDQFFRL